jgi:hypothetical protein
MAGPIERQAVEPSLVDKAPFCNPSIVSEEDDRGSDIAENQHTQAGGRELDMAGILDDSVPGSFTLLQCRTVRIVSCKMVPKDRVLLLSVGIRNSSH